jgi:hypothetical protein
MEIVLWVLGTAAIGCSCMFVIAVLAGRTIQGADTAKESVRRLFGRNGGLVAEVFAWVGMIDGFILVLCGYSVLGLLMAVSVSAASLCIGWPYYAER